MNVGVLLSQLLAFRQLKLLSNRQRRAAFTTAPRPAIPARDAPNQGNKRYATVGTGFEGGRHARKIETCVSNTDSRP